MPWVSRLLKVRQARDLQAFVAHQLVEEARVQQVQDGVLDAADVLVDRQPVVGAFVDHGVVRLRRRRSGRSTRRTRRRCPWCRFAPRGPPHFGQGFVELGHFASGEPCRPAPRFRQHHRQLVVRHRHVAAARRSGSSGSGSPSSAGARCPSRAGGTGFLAQPLTSRSAAMRIDRSRNF